MGIWLFNPNAISPSHLEPSMATHNFDLPNSEQPIHLLKVEHLETDLELYKNPGTSPLWLVLKYPLQQHSKQVEDLEVNKVQPEIQQPKKKWKTMPFSWLLTSEESLCLLREVEEDAERVANEKKEKKEIAIQKQIAKEWRRHRNKKFPSKKKKKESVQS
ncbi:12508_t:CDS:2 [Dentiscutata heterogama]|uniref:12508_t:CDS:1 n=1 Tax=Dentiscutata heterogama TaxID=1316150 RepID=A0ACA9K247_9GLOM|nr:12508_t:CDS:2 [Dentiscutata heterogama]